MSEPHPARAPARQAILDAIRPELAKRDAEAARRKTQARIEIELKPVSRAERIDRIRDTAKQVSGLPRDRLLAVNIPCPMLQPDGACGIYPARPLNCRAYHSLDVTACRASFENPGDPSLTHPQSGWVAAINGGAQEGLRDGLRAIGADTTQYEFVTALAEAFDDPDCGRRHDAGEAVFRRALRL
jgi:hypothetical protein